MQDLSDTAGLGYTRFIRTTEEPHKAAVQHLWRQLDSRGHIYKGSHAGWYAVSDEAFYPEGQLRDVKDVKTGEQYKVSIESGQRVEWAEEENYKFKLSAMQKPLLDWLHSDPAPVQPRKYWEQVVAEVEAGLQDLSISRPASRLYWGIQVPDDTSHSIYVWIDALTNYLTVTGYPEGAAEAWPADVHVVGKDILRFHAIYWPAMLLAAGLPPPRCVLSHGHWTMDRAKMSKSRGNVVNPFEAIEQYGLDTLRFFLMRVGGSFSTDSDFSHNTLVEYHRKHLQGQLGNLLSRVLAPKILARLGPSEGSIEIARPKTDPRTEELQRSLEALPHRFDGLMADFELSKALEAVFESIARVSAGMTLQQWTQIADEHLLTGKRAHIRDRAVVLVNIHRGCCKSCLPCCGDAADQRSSPAAIHTRQSEGAPAESRRQDWLVPSIQPDAPRHDTAAVLAEEDQAALSSSICRELEILTARSFCFCPPLPS